MISCFPMCASPEKRARESEDEDGDDDASVDDAYFDAAETFDRMARLTVTQPDTKSVSDDANETFEALSRVSERLEKDSRGMGSIKATAAAATSLLKMISSNKAIDLTSFLGTPIRWCSRFSVLRIATDSVSPISKSMPSRTFRMYEMLRRVDVGDESTAESRFLGVLGAFIAECEPPRSLKKPMNPVLGEVAKHDIAFADGATFRSVWEQCEHHPPVTANWCEGDEIVVAGNVQPKPHLVGAHVEVALAGYVQFIIKRRDETYEASMPSFEWRFFPRWYSRMTPDATFVLKCEKTGFEAELKYSTKHSCHHIKGVIRSLGAGNAVAYVVDGRYDGKVFAKRYGVVGAESEPPRLLYDAEEFLRLGESGEDKKRWSLIKRHDDARDTEKVWAECFAAMDRNDWDAAKTAKRRVEDAERRARRSRAERGETWCPKYFSRDVSTGRWVRNDVPT